MKCYEWVIQDVAHVDGLPFSRYLRMFPLHKPSNMREKHSSHGVMWIGVCVSEFMMHSVVANPFVNVVLSDFITYTVTVFKTSKKFLKICSKFDEIVGKILQNFGRHFWRKLNIFKKMPETGKVFAPSACCLT